MAGEGASPFASQDDPVEAQKVLCAVIAQLVQSGPPEPAQLDELSTLERNAQAVGKALLNRYVEGDSSLRTFDWRAWQAAIRLSQALYQANEHFLRCIRSETDATWAGREPSVLVQLFHHRKVEFLLRFLRYKKRSPGQWRELHEMYRRGRELERLASDNADGQSDAAGTTDGRLEQQYLQILLLETMNSGQFSPREALWAHRWFARWCSGPGLQLAPVKGDGQETLNGFVVDLAGSDGLRRVPVVAEDPHFLDPAPLCAMIGQEIASLRSNAKSLRGVTPAVRSGQLALLDKLAVLFAPVAADFGRRAERKALELTVQAIAGFPYIVEELRKEKQKRTGGSSRASEPDVEITISPLGRPAQLNVAGSRDIGPATLSMTTILAAIPQSWQVKDRSDSGCRMRGQIDNMNRVIPGSLIAVRDDATSPWILSVVRRFRRLMVDHVEIGVEYLGRKPRFVKLVADHDRDSDGPASPDGASRCFAALYLPPSEELPTMPIKTLLLPAREFRAGCTVTLLSSNATYKMRLNEPLQQQFEFVLTTFSVIEKSAPQAASTR